MTILSFSLAIGRETILPLPPKPSAALLGTENQPNDLTHARRDAADAATNAVGQWNISVIVPAFNAQATLAPCLESLFAQTLRAFEIIVVDDASTDGTRETARRFPVKLLRLEANSGPGVARNEGAKAACGAVLAFTDSDCVAPPDWLERMAAALSEPDVVAATGGYSGSAAPGFLPRLQQQLLQQRQSRLPAEIASTITSNLLCRADAFASVGGFPVYYCGRRSNRPVWGNEDEELGMLLALRGGRIRWLKDVGVAHHFRPGLGDFLRQQRFYAEAILMSHLHFSSLWALQSNYSRGDGALHVLLAAATAAGALLTAMSLLFEPSASARLGHGILLALTGLCALAWLSLPIPAVRDLARRGEAPLALAGAYGVMLLVDFAWMAGLSRGLVRSLQGFRSADPQGAASTAPPPA